MLPHFFLTLFCIILRKTNAQGFSGMILLPFHFLFCFFSPFVYFPRMSICNIVQLYVYNFFIAFFYGVCTLLPYFLISHFSSFNYVYTCPAVEYLHQLDNFLSTIIRNSFNFLFGKFHNSLMHLCVILNELQHRRHRRM